MTDGLTQRVYSAPCPGCGAPVEFRSAQSAFAVCGYCKSTVARQGEVLTRIGKMAELFEDYSPLQLMASGRWHDPKDGKLHSFTVIGRIQYRSSNGSWSDWQLALDDGTPASLSEDNGSFVFSRNLPTTRELPRASYFRVGATSAIDGRSFTVASCDSTVVVAAQGELPKLPVLGQPFDLVELRSEQGEVLSIDYGSLPPAISLGRAVELEALQMTGLREQSAKAEQGQQFNCPHCGAPLTPLLASTKSMTCTSCRSIIDLSAGVGGQLRHAVQDEPMQLLIPLGSGGVLQGVPWQVVGFQHRMGREAGDDEQFGWSEYLLYHQKRGFSFLVDSTEGWSLVRPTTGSPQMERDGQSASYLGARYQLKSAYAAETIYVQGEFYWPVERGQRSNNRDFANGRNLLSLEQSKNEQVWSAGSVVDSTVVAKAFKLDAQAGLFRRSDVSPLALLGGDRQKAWMYVFFAFIVVAVILDNCSNNNCDPATEDCRANASGGAVRSAGGAFGGFSGGGGHK